MFILNENGKLKSTALQAGDMLFFQEHAGTVSARRGEKRLLFYNNDDELFIWGKFADAAILMAAAVNLECRIISDSCISFTVVIKVDA